MSYINKSTTINQLREIVDGNFNRQLGYMPNSFNEEQKHAIELFKQRLFLEEVIDETISFNKSLQWEQNTQNLHLTTTAEELVQVYNLRSTVYKDLGYDDEFPDVIEGLNFDDYDKSSAVIYYRNNSEITATCRLIFDSPYSLPSEDKFSYDDFRLEHNCIGEISRNIIKHKSQGLNMEFKYLMRGVYNVFINNDIDIALSVIKQDHLKLFHKLGGVEVVEELKGYGELDNSFYVISYDPKYASKFFKKVFLN